MHPQLTVCSFAMEELHESSVVASRDEDTASAPYTALSWCCTHQLLNTLFEIYLV